MIKLPKLPKLPDLPKQKQNNDLQLQLEIAQNTTAEYKQRCEAALKVALCLGSFDGAHHKAYALDQVVRLLTGCKYQPAIGVDCNGNPFPERVTENKEYTEIIARHKAGEDGPDSYSWEVGIPP